MNSNIWISHSVLDNFQDNLINYNNLKDINKFSKIIFHKMKDFHFNV